MFKTVPLGDLFHLGMCVGCLTRLHIVTTQTRVRYIARQLEKMLLSRSDVILWDGTSAVRKAGQVRAACPTSVDSIFELHEARIRRSLNADHRLSAPEGHPLRRQRPTLKPLRA